MTVEAVLFDLDDTLCTYNRPGAELLPIAFERAGVEPFFTVDEYHRRYGEFVEGSATTAELRERCFATIAEERGYDPETGRAVAEAYAAERDHGNVSVRPGVEAALATLAQTHRLGIVTNGAPGMQQEKLDATGLAEYFETMVNAGFDTPSKPDPAPFEQALRTLDVGADRAVYVGNSLTSDVAGARAAGLRSVWIPVDEPAPNPQPRPDHVLRSPEELLPPPWE
ncbi:MAG: HAD family hydrolase [Halobacteriales archaeon]|nr:HAD family hydrolase [Halobacteriales archaeon]